MSVSMKKAAEMVKQILSVNLVPFLQGSPGIGKSAIIKEVADGAKLKVIDLRLSQCEPTDLLGLPVLSEKKAKYKAFDTFPLEKDKVPAGYNGWLLFLDELNSAPRSMLFSPDGKYAYLICQLMNCVNVYKYSSENGLPEFEKIQQISTLGKSYNDKSAVAALRFTNDGKYLFCSNAGDNSVAFFERDLETGMLEKKSVLPISGDYPKQICVFPDDKHLASMNHESNTITFFEIDYEKGLLVMHGTPIKVETPNVAVIAKVKK